MKYAENNNLDGVLTTSDYPVNVVASISKKLHLTAMSEDVAKICTNKYLQRELFLRSGVILLLFIYAINKLICPYIKNFLMW